MSSGVVVEAGKAVAYSYRETYKLTAAPHASFKDTSVKFINYN